MYQINFLSNTHVTDLKDEPFPSLMFNFRSFSEISAISVDDVEHTPLCDVIGLMTLQQPPKDVKVKRGDRSLLINIVLENDQGSTMECTLWDDYAKQLLNYREKVKEGPVIIILELCKVKEFKGEISVQTTFDVPKLHINEKLMEVDDFRQRLVAANRLIDGPPAISESLNVNVSAALELSQEKLRCTEEILMSEDGNSSWILGVIDDVEIYNGEWFFAACTTCSKKVNELEGGQYFCETREAPARSPGIRYKFFPRIMDDKGNLQVTLWDKEATQLIGWKASDLKRQIIKSEDSSSEPLPIDIKKLIGKKVLFLIETHVAENSIFGPSYVVKRQIVEDSIVEKYDTQESSVNTFKTESGVLSEVNSSETEVGTPLESDGKGKEHVDGGDESSIKRKLFGDDASANRPNQKKIFVPIKQEKD